MTEHYSNQESVDSPIESLKPKLDVHIRYSPHTTVEDFGDLDRELRHGGYDFYAPEIAGHTPDKVAMLEKIAKGDTKTYQKVMVGFDKFSVGAMFRAVFASRIIVLHADSSREQLRQYPDDLRSFGDEQPRTFTDLDEFVDYSRQRAELGARFTTRRDEVFVNNLEGLLPERIKPHPRLSAAENIGVLITMGDNHISLPRILEERGYRVRVSGLPEVYFAPEEALVGYINGHVPSDELMLEVAASNIIRPNLYHPYTNELRKIVRQITGKLSREEVEWLLKTGQTEGTAVVYPFIQDKLDKLDIDDTKLRLEAVPLGSVPKE